MSPCDVVAREVVHNGQPAFPTACSAGKPPKWKGKGSSRQPSFLPTGISKKDWACLSTREISCPLIHGSTGGMNRPSGPASPCWQGSIGDFIPTFISYVKLYSCLCYEKRAGLNNMYPAPLPNHRLVTRAERHPSGKCIFCKLCSFRSFLGITR